MISKKVILCILDGFGIGDKTYKYNAVFQGDTPNFQRFLTVYPNAMLETSGEAVGLPHGQMGNSEVGHMTLGSGRVIYQDLPRINKAVKSGELANKLRNIRTKNTIHLVGLCSNGGVHSSLEHIKYIYKVLQEQGKSVVLHVITDGRDVPPKDFINTLKEFDGMNVGTISGRFFAMDRDKKFERTQNYFNAIQGKSMYSFTDIKKAVDYFYSKDITDEFIEPSVIGNFTGIKQDDCLFIANFRADRVRQLSSMALNSNLFDNIICMTHYSNEIALKSMVLFPQHSIQNTLVEVLEKHEKNHLHIAETEKYAHVTFFFNGGKEEHGKFEKRILVQSPNVKTYDMQPEMSIYELQEKLFPEVKSQKHDFIVINIANGDMVGHTGNFEASKQAAQHIDLFLGKLEEIALECKYHLLITADHGNLEEMVDVQTQEIHTQHTTGPVPIIYITDKKDIKIHNGTLANVAPTVLKLMEVDIPEEMENGLI